MGAWGAGNFENDDALDLIGELAPDSCAARLEQIFDAAAAQGAQGEEIDATDAAYVLTGAELLAAARGHASLDFPEEYAPLAAALKTTPPELAQKAVSAVSYVLMSSELVELWAESDDPSEWNEVAGGLVARLDAPAREKNISKGKRNGMSSCICSFCGDRIPNKDLVSLDMRRPWTPTGMSHGIFAHESCLSSKLHPRHILQWWTPDLD